MTVVQLRGRDSTGVISVDMKGEYEVVKRLGPPEFLLETKAYDKHVDTGFKKVLIGHCRAKTYGAVSLENAHPFEHGGIVGVHNGTLRGHYNLERSKDFDVDSDWLYWHISEYGVAATISQLDADGAWALVYWDETAKTLNFLRNKERPLYGCHSEDRKVMFWFSEPWMAAIIERRGIKLHESKDESKIWAFPTDTLWSFEVSGSGQKASDIFQMLPPVEVKGEVRSYTGNVRGFSGNPYGYHRPNVGAGGQVTSPFPVETLEDDLDDDISSLNVVHLLPHHPKQESTKTAAESQTTLSGGDSSSKSSQVITASKTEPKSGQSSGRQKLSLRFPNSSSFLPESNGSVSSNSKGCTSSLVKLEGKTSFRQVLGTWYVTDHKTGREFSEQDFEEATDCKCSFCTAPIGDLKEVAEIFHRDKGTFNEEVTFLGTCCSNPPLRI